MTAVVGLVLAAGAGTRFGGPKAVVEIDGERLVDRAVRTLLDGGAAPAYVVTGALDVEVAGAIVVANPGWDEGIGPRCAPAWPRSPTIGPTRSLPWCCWWTSRV